MASLTVTPSEVSVGHEFVVTAEDFNPATVVALTLIPPAGGGDVISEITSDAAGQVASTDSANQATTVLTSTGVNVTLDDTVTIGTVQYIFKATPTTTANEVKRGSDAAESLANLKAAVNKAAGAGTKYGSETVANPDVRAGKLTATTLLLIAKVGGTGGNSLASTKNAVTLSFTGANFAGGAAATGVDTFRYIPEIPGVWTIQGSDGTNTATTTVRVWTST